MATPTTRVVLSEISDRAIRLANTPTDELLLMANDPIPANILNNSFDADPLGYLAPSLPSPDEIIIRQRGRRKIKLNWSPDKCPTPSRCPFQKTPTKVASTQMTLRSSPRKRLLDGLNFQTTPEKANKASPMKTSSSSTTPLLKRLMLDDPDPSSSPSSKRLRIDEEIPLVNQLKSDEKNLSQLNRKLPLRTRLNHLNQKQLVGVVMSMLQQNPQMETYVKKILPKPDLSAMSEDLKRIVRSLNRSVPRSTSRQCSTSHVRGESYLMDFKNVLVSQATYLYNMHLWSLILDYHKTMWPIICSLPIANSPTHSNVRSQCFSLLCNLATMAIKVNGTRFGRDRLAEFARTLQEKQKDSNDISQVLHEINVALRKFVGNR